MHYRDERPCLTVGSAGVLAPETAWPPSGRTNLGSWLRLTSKYDGGEHSDVKVAHSVQRAESPRSVTGSGRFGADPAWGRPLAVDVASKLGAAYGDEVSPRSARLDQIVRLGDGRVLGYAEYGSADGLPLFVFHGFPGCRLACAELWNTEPTALRVIAPD